MRTHAAIALLVVMVAVPLRAQVLGISKIEPNEGFNFAPTHVTIRGSAFDRGAVTVLFDDVPATILSVTANELRVIAHPTANGTIREEGYADVTIRVAGVGELTMEAGFHFHPLAHASAADYQPVLVPLTSDTIRGANGSIWTAELFIFNASSLPLRMPGPDLIGQGPDQDPPVIVPPHETEQVFLERHHEERGHFLYVPNGLASAPKFSLRARDLSRNATTLGTEIPVVKRSQAANDILLVDIPTDPAYRATLRIYSFRPEPLRVGVRVYPEDGDTLIEQYDVELHGVVNHDFVYPFPPYPAAITLNPFTPAVRASGHERVRIELTNYGSNVSPPPPPIWAFVSITHNETQQVTTVTPR